MAAAKGAAAVVKRRAISITSSFFRADFGMRGYEPLARASAFMVPVEAALKGNQDAPLFHIVTVKHVTHPHKTTYYDDSPFVGLLDDDDIRVTAELRDSTGQIIQRHPIRQRMFPHPFRDLTVMHLEREHEEAFAKGLRATNTWLCKLYTGETPQGINLRCHGHRTTRDLIAADRDEEGKVTDGAKPEAAAEAELSEEEARAIAAAGVPLHALHGEKETPMPPDVVAGMFLGANEVRGFARTAEPLVTGMCGGPIEGVVAPQGHGQGDDGNEGNEEGESGITLGMCEGILTESAVAALLPEEEAGKATSGSDAASKRASLRTMLKDAAVFVPAEEIYAFLQHVEQTELQLK